MFFNSCFATRFRIPKNRKFANFIFQYSTPEINSGAAFSDTEAQSPAEHDAPMRSGTPALAGASMREEGAHLISAQLRHTKLPTPATKTQAPPEASRPNRRKKKNAVSRESRPAHGYC